MFGKIPMKLVILSLVLFLAGLTYTVKYSVAGHGVVEPDEAQDLTVGYWDQRDRETFLQTTNTSGSTQRVHVQVFNFVDPNFPTLCTEFNFFDDYTGLDSHVYALSNLTRNDGKALAPPDFSDGFGVISVQAVSSTGSAQRGNDVLISVFRIIDLLGNYEYRATATQSIDSSADEWAFNFNNANGRNLADIILVDFDLRDDSGAGGIDLDSVDVRKIIIDTGENQISCAPEITIGCDTDDDSFIDGPINFGINGFFVNSRGGPSLCGGTDKAGTMGIELDRDDVFIGWVGLNNGDGSGSMEVMPKIDDDTFIIPD